MMQNLPTVQYQGFSYDATPVVVGFALARRVVGGGGVLDLARPMSSVQEYFEVVNTLSNDTQSQY